METDMNGKRACNAGEGPLPCCAPLAAAYVPRQQTGQTRYRTPVWICRGKTFPTKTPVRLRIRPWENSWR